MVVYRSKMTHGKNKANFKVFHANEFIAVITQHIPDKSFQLVRYYGWYSNRSRGDRRKKAELRVDMQDSTAVPEEIETLDVSAHKPCRIPFRTWRECIKKVWEVDPLECPKCHVEMKIISFITISQPEVIQQILEHLGLYKKSRPPPDKPHASGDVIHELFDDGWPGYEEPFHTVN